ncbi:hypothetical protein J7643_15435 [bacterium]|nr:hypothetical protein [bacterium]
MRKASAIKWGLLPLLASLALTGCGRTPTSVITEPQTGAGLISTINQRPELPQGVYPVSLAVTPNVLSVTVGEQRQFAVAIQGSDGKTYQDPRLVNWSLSDAQAGTINEQGVFTPQLQRVVTVRATLMDRVSDVTVTIAPAVYSWQQVQSPTSADLYAAKMVSPKEAWVGGANGTLLHLLNGSWQLVPGGNAAYTWRGADFAAAGSGWMVGHQGNSFKATTPAIAMQYRGGSWVGTNTGVNGSLLGVSALADGTAWAAGRDAAGKVLLMKWNGTSWTRDNSYNKSGHINAVQMLGPSSGWAVGSDGDNALVLHFDGTRWEKSSLPVGFGIGRDSELFGLQMFNDQQGYAVGSQKDLLGVKRGLMLVCDGRGSNVVNFSNWKVKEANEAGVKFLDQVPLRGISMIDGNKGWILGGTVDPNRLPDPGSWFSGTISEVYGNLLGFDGTTYRIDNNFQYYNLSKEFNGIHVLPQGDGLIVGKQGYLMQRAYDWRNTSTGGNYNNYGGQTGTQTGEY